MKTLTVKEFAEKYPDAQFVSTTQDVMAVKEYIGKKAEGFDSFFAVIENGDYEVLCGMYGIVPFNDRPVYPIIELEK